ncbi:ABC transporter permease subunit [Nocardioides sp. AE5]|uniref:ABC transporter permease subunit n=1 Tax=Nocardioides sp. AE5 TaxID=2962573 RepID=UPI002882156A|nr:ABC transporter permease subunit [Nocardioides sp. AE5]MDT0202848.1 ABC transporter permease subunit [Nocardioides sp. AE5]
MSTTTATETTAPRTTPSRPAAHRDHAPIPFTRLVSVEARKMFNTRSGFWMMTSIVLLALAATATTILFTDPEDLDYGRFAGAIGTPMAIILPMVAVLAVTSEWSQRSALTTFTLVPSRNRVIAAKAVVTVLVGVISMVIATAVGALGNVVGTAIAGVDPVWSFSLREFGQIVLANEIGMFIGFTLGVLIRNSPGAIVGYFVFSLVLPGISGALAASQQWYADNVGWVDLNWTTYKLFDSELSSTEWSQLAFTTTLWVLVPLALGLVLLRRSEVK